MQSSSKLLSIIVPLFNEEANIKHLLNSLQQFQSKAREINLEFIFVDDHSSDRTVEILKVLTEHIQNIKIIKLAHNSGSHAAIMAGLTCASGNCATFIAGDLQDPPEVIHELVEKWTEGFKIVWAAREEEQGYGRPTFSRLYWWICSNLIDSSIPERGVDFFLIDRSVIDVVTNKPHRWSPIFVSIGSTKFNSTTVIYTKKERKTGKSSWTLSRKLLLVLDTMVMSFSAVRWLCASGLVISSLGLLGLPVCIFATAVGWLTTIAGLVLIAICTVLCAMGFQTILLGLVAENVYRALSELRETPRFVIEDEFCTNNNTDSIALETKIVSGSAQIDFAPDTLSKGAFKPDVQIVSTEK